MTLRLSKVNSPKKNFRKECHSLNLHNDPLKTYFFNNTTPSSEKKESFSSSKSIVLFESNRINQTDHKTVGVCTNHTWGKLQKKHLISNYSKNKASFFALFQKSKSVLNVIWKATEKKYVQRHKKSPNLAWKKVLTFLVTFEKKME